MEQRVELEQSINPYIYNIQPLEYYLDGKP